MYGFDRERIVAGVVRVLNSDWDYVAQKGSYFKAADIEDVEVWWIGIRVKFRSGIMPRRFTMVSKSDVCAKSLPSKQEVIFAHGGKSIGDRIHLSTYRFLQDSSGEEHTWTTCLGYDTKAEADAMRYWLWQKDMAAHSVVRPGKRTRCRWELKIWCLDPEVLNSCISKVIHTPTLLVKCGTPLHPHGKREPFPNNKSILQTLYNLKASKGFVERKIAAHPEWGLEIEEGRIEEAF